jgi:hypothetical protein
MCRLVGPYRCDSCDDVTRGHGHGRDARRIGGQGREAQALGLPNGLK